MGAWLAVNGESVYGTRAGPVQGLTWARSTRAGRKTYVHVFDWPPGGKLQLPLAGPASVAYLLADPSRTPLKIQSYRNELAIHGPAYAPDEVDSVVVVEG